MSKETRFVQKLLLCDPRNLTYWEILLGRKIYSESSVMRRGESFVIKSIDFPEDDLLASSATISSPPHSDQQPLHRGVFTKPEIADYTAEGVFQRAKQLVDDEAFEVAIRLVEEWIGCAREHGEDAMLAFIRAHAYRKLNRADEALSILEPYRQETTIPWVPFELGLIYKELGRADEAYLCFRQAGAIQPDFTWAAIEAVRTTQEFNVAMGRLEVITSPANEFESVEVRLERSLRCGSLLLLIGWCREAYGSGTQAWLSDPLAPGTHAFGSSIFYHRPDVCQSLGMPEHERHGFAALLECSAFRRWSELGVLRLCLEPEGEARSLSTTATLCLSEVPEETNLPGFFEAAMGVFRVSIDSGNRWPDSLKLFTPQTVLETARVFARHVEEERDDVEAHWLTRLPMETPPLASVVFVQLGSFLTAKPAILQLAQSGLPLELIVVNNSPELFSETFHILDRYADIRPDLRIGILNRALNLGFSAGCNLGAQHASGECLLFHNNDVFADSVMDYKLLITRSLNEPNAIHSAYQYFTDGTLMQEGLTATRLTTAKGSDIPLFNGFSVGRNQTRAEVIACSGSLMAISAPLFKHLGGFSEEMVYAHFEDFDLCLRARQEGIPVRVWKDIRFYHAEGTGSVAPYHLNGTTSHINRLLFSLKWRRVLEGMALPVEYSL
jgi:GT2 family glycosyltransferase/tetratricopeptide (TPR) repeat protein